jgi:uncharacterized protein YjiS (DUF1127 family)
MLRPQPKRSAATSVAGETSARDQRHVLVNEREEKALPTFDLYLPPQHIRRGVRSSASTPVAAAWMLVASWIERVRQRNALVGLNDQQLRDIGITRVDAARECEKPFWR